ncbi:MAG: CheR family methyltransferase [Gemmatimonadaceae bacterium]
MPARKPTSRPQIATDVVDGSLEALLDYLKRSRGFDFTGYKRASLARRIEKRMGAVNSKSFSDYVDYLEVHPEEFSALFNTILINVTSFFRDDGTFEFLQKEVIPQLLERKGPNASIRVWSAGCASGEEPYTLAILFAELMGAEAFRERVKIYATDADEDALTRARLAVYDEKALGDVPEPLRAKYFDANDGIYTFRKEYRRQVIFGRHDLIQDAPISRVDLLVCRNVLMYFNAETQARILSRFHFALNDGGILFLGRAETLLSHATTFTPVDLKRRISMKVPRANLSLRDRLLLVAQNGLEDPASLAQNVRLREVALDSAPTAQVVLDPQGTVVLANERARQLFTLSVEDVGRPLQDLKLSYRPVELRSLIDQVNNERRPLLVRDVEFRLANGEIRWFDLQLNPLIDTSGAMLGVSAAYADVTAPKRLQSELEHTNMELEAAYEELQSTNEELETTNEELQSTVEELETTNEELQSTNEELETMNEELHSTNEELNTINDELRLRSEELHEVNGFLESVLASLRGAVVVLDRDLMVIVWSERATDLWGLREQEALGKHFFALDIGLPVEKLKGAIKSTASGEMKADEFVVEATNRRGRPIHVRVVAMPLVSVKHEPRGVILVMDDVSGEIGSIGPAKRPAIVSGAP